MTPSAWRLACCQYPITYLDDFDGFRRKIAVLVDEACAAGARLLVFPEYGAMELASLLAPAERADLRRQRHGLQPMLPAFLDLFAGEARRSGRHIVAPSFPVAVGADSFVNRAHLVGPDGDTRFQDKLNLTRFERETWGIGAGEALKVFDTALGRLAVCVCYDIEFPTLARAQAAAGAELIVVPSCTDGAAGYNRVRIAARARALENQCLVATAPTVGEATWSPAIDVNVGAAGVYAPPDRGFPADGVLAEGTLNAPGWVYADIDLGAVATLRTDPQVFLRRDWHALGDTTQRVIAERLEKTSRR
jgi:predicted amidohydrolase